MNNIDNDYAYWRQLAADKVNHFWFTNREAGVLLAEIDRLRAEIKQLREAEREET